MARKLTEATKRAMADVANGVTRYRAALDHGVNPSGLARALERAAKYTVTVDCPCCGHDYTVKFTPDDNLL